jgi:hypothetical protein
MSRLGKRYEGCAKARALELLDARPGQRALNVRVGTGLDHRRLQAAVLPEGGGRPGSVTSNGRADADV